MFGAVASLRKEISPQAKRRKSTPLVRTPFTSPMTSTSNGKAESTSNAFLSVQLSRTSCELTKNILLLKWGITLKTNTKELYWKLFFTKKINLWGEGEGTSPPIPVLVLNNVRSE
jgi:hypothetical protein